MRAQPMPPIAPTGTVTFLLAAGGGAADRIMAAKKKELKVWSASDLGLADNQVGSAGAMYQVIEVLLPERKSRVEIISGSPEEAAAKLVEKLRKEAKKRIS